MKKCPFCAEEIQDEAIVCRYCGRDIEPDLPPDDRKKCPYCAEWIRAEAIKCRYCGSKISPLVEPAQDKENNHEVIRRSYTPLPRSVEKLFWDLKAESRDKRLLAARKLGNQPLAYKQVLKALEVVSKDDDDSLVRGEATLALKTLESKPLAQAITEEMPTVKQRRCHKCNYVISPAHLFCANCGAAVSKQVETSIPSTQEASIESAKEKTPKAWKEGLRVGLILTSITALSIFIQDSIIITSPVQTRSLTELYDNVWGFLILFLYYFVIVIIGSLMTKLWHKGLKAGLILTSLNAISLAFTERSPIELYGHLTFGLPFLFIVYWLIGIVIAYFRQPKWD